MYDERIEQLPTIHYQRSMLLQPQLSNKALTELCHRLAVETDSGIDIRRTWQREAEMARGRVRPYFDKCPRRRRPRR